MASAKQSIPFIVPPQPVRSYAKKNRELAAAFDRLLVSRAHSARTRESYNETISKLLEFVGATDVSTLDRAGIGGFLAQLHGRGFSANSLNRHTFGLRAFYRFLRLAGITGADPMRFVPFRKIPYRMPRLLSEAEVVQLIEAARTPRDLAIVEVFYGTAARVSELTHMRLEDVDFDGGRILIRRGKGDRDRYVPFLPGSKAWEAVKSYLASYKPESGFLFEASPGRGHLRVRRIGRGKYWYGYFYRNRHRAYRYVYVGRVASFPTQEVAREEFDRILANTPDFTPRPAKPLTVRGVAMILNRIANRAGIGHVHPHLLRHACATHLWNRGMDIRYVQEIVGHQLLSTTQRYAHGAIADLMKTHAKYHPHAEGDDHAKE